MRTVLAVLIFMIGTAHAFAGDSCKPDVFPDFWADAAELVTAVKSDLAMIEKKTTYAQKSARAFNESLALCKDQRKALYNDAGSGGDLTQYKCEHQLICARLSIIKGE